uniref:PH domain-containing protein n=1 Tax=Brachyspira catarrhinii TaxID=2528966 RepID=UPI003F4C325D
MFCQNCGTKNDDNVKFCSNCGSPIGNTSNNTADSINIVNSSENSNNNQSKPSNNIERVKKQVEAIKDSTDTWFTKKELDELPNVIHDDEDVLYFTSGYHESNNNTMIIVLTTKRIIFLDKGMFVSRRQFDIPLDVINSVQSYTGLMFGELTIVHGAHSEVISNIDKKTVVLFQEMATKEVEKYKKNVKQRENENLASMLKGVGGGTSKSKYVIFNGVYINTASISEVKIEEDIISITTFKNGYLIKYSDESKALDDYNKFISFIADETFEFRNN